MFDRREFGLTFDTVLMDRARCTGPERATLDPLIDAIVGCSERARREGLLSLEDGLDTVEPPLLRTGLQLVVDGTDPEYIYSLLHNAALADGAEGIDLLRRLVCIAGALRIQAGDNPRLLKMLLRSLAHGEVLP